MRFIYMITTGLLLTGFSSTVKAQPCTVNQSVLLSASGTYTIPAGQILCIDADFCMGGTSNFPGACANSSISSLIIDGTLRILHGITFKFQGSIAGTGKIQVLGLGRFSLFGSVNCASGLELAAVDATATGGNSSSSALVSCNATSCEPQFSDGYAPFGIVANGLGYTASGCTIITGHPNEPNLLPVTLTGFSASLQEQSVVLSWKTSSEQNNRQFDIERAVPGGDWAAIATVFSKALDGNSNQLLSYQYVDNTTAAFTSLFYRLKQIDLNGSYTYSQTITVKGLQKNEWRVATVANAIHLQLNSGRSQKAQVMVIGTGGNRVYTAPWNLTAGNNHLSVNTTGFAKGVYVVTVQTDGEMRRGRVVVQ